LLLNSISSDRVSGGKRTFDRFAVPGRRNLLHALRDGPILVPSLNKSHRELGSVPGGLDYISAPACSWVLRRGANDNRLGADGGEAIDVRP
jgi:hypothetical protein